MTTYRTFAGDVYTVDSHPNEHGSYPVHIDVWRNPSSTLPADDYFALEDAAARFVRDRVHASFSVRTASQDAAFEFAKKAVMQSPYWLGVMANVRAVSETPLELI